MYITISQKINFTRSIIRIMEITSEQLRDKILSLVHEKQGQEVVCLDLRDISNYTDYFIICNTDIEKQAQSIAQHIEKTIKENLKIKPYNIEGVSLGKWILIDYIDIICHIFTRDTRDYYKLEQLWAGGRRIENNP